MTNSTLIDNPSMGIYHAKLTDADTAIASVVSGSSVAIGMAAGQPPALLRALAARAERGEIDRVKLFYFHAEAPMAPDRAALRVDGTVPAALAVFAARRP